MAVNIGNPGFGAYKNATVRLALVVLVGGYLAAVVIVGIAWMLGRSPWLVSIIGLILIAAETWHFRGTLADIREVYSDGRNWLKGARGESRVHAELDRLPEEFIVFHDFHPLQGDGDAADWNIDHIVIGPTGVFVVDAKNYGSRVVLSAAHSEIARKNIAQVARCSRELKTGIVKWSGGSLATLFVVPVVVYAQEGAHVESLREGHTRVLPLRMLITEIERHAEAAIDMDKAYRIARVLYDQMPVGDRTPFEPEIRAYGATARRSSGNTRSGAAALPATEEREPETGNPAPVCPRCGAILAVKEAKKGVHKGKLFLGCSKFPACNYLRPLPDSTPCAPASLRGRSGQQAQCELRGEVGST